MDKEKVTVEVGAAKLSLVEKLSLGAGFDEGTISRVMPSHTRTHTK